MTHITDIISTEHTDVEPEVDSLAPRRWAVKKTPSVLLVSDTQDKVEAEEFYRILRADRDALPRITVNDLVITPPLKSFRHNNYYIFRVDHPARIDEVTRKYLVKDEFRQKKEILQASRQLNPPEMTDRKSFLEMLDKAYRERQPFNLFLRNLMREWANENRPMSSRYFASFVEEKNTRDENNIFPKFKRQISGWLQDPPDGRPSVRTMQGIINAFSNYNSIGKIHVQNGDTLKLCRIVNGNPVNIDETQTRIDQALQDKNHGELFAWLMDNSGIDPTLLAEWSGISYATLWGMRHGQHIITHQENVSELLNLLNPPTLHSLDPEEEQIVRQNKIIESMLTNRPLNLTFEEMVQKAREASCASTALLHMMVGPHGKIPMDYDQISAYMSKELNRPYSARQAEYRWRGVVSIIIEDEAQAIARLAKCEPDQVETCVEILTGIASPDKLMAEAIKPHAKMTVRTVFRLSCERKGITQHDFAIPQQTVWAFENRPDVPLLRATATHLANGIGLTGETHRNFVLLAMHRSSVNAMAKVKAAIKNPSLRNENLRVLVESIGRDPKTLCKEMKVPARVFKEWIQTGLIACTHSAHVAAVMTRRLLMDDMPGNFAAAFEKAFIKPVSAAERSEVSLQRTKEASPGPQAG